MNLISVSAIIFVGFVRSATVKEKNGSEKSTLESDKIEDITQIFGNILSDESKLKSLKLKRVSNLFENVAEKLENLSNDKDKENKYQGTGRESGKDEEKGKKKNEEKDKLKNVSEIFKNLSKKVNNESDKIATQQGVKLFTGEELNQLKALVRDQTGDNETAKEENCGTPCNDGKERKEEIVTKSFDHIDDIDNEEREMEKGRDKEKEEGNEKDRVNNKGEEVDGEEAVDAKGNNIKGKSTEKQKEKEKNDQGKGKQTLDTKLHTTSTEDLK